jgi:hypothetical protein
MQPLLYGELASWYRLVDPPDDHRTEAEFYIECFERAVSGPCETLLELGAGAGHNGLHLKKRLRCTLSDLSEAMRTLSLELNPECEHVAGDMRTMRLERTFDAVLVHDAICYMTTREDLEAAARTAFVNTRPGGAAMFVPDCVRETFHEQSELQGAGAGERSARFLMWTWDPDPTDEAYRVDFAFLFREGITCVLPMTRTWRDSSRGRRGSTRFVASDSTSRLCKDHSNQTARESKTCSFADVRSRQSHSHRRI